MKAKQRSQLEIRYSSPITTSRLTSPSGSTKNKPSEKTVLKGINTNNLLEMIEGFQDQQKQFMKGQKFNEAKDTEEKITEMKVEVISRQFKELNQTHQEEVQKITEAQISEVENFNNVWESKITDYTTEAEKIEEQLAEKHRDDLQQLRKSLEASLQIRPKTSSQHLNFKKMIESLAKQGQFAEAEKLKAKCEKLRVEEVTKSKVEKENKIKVALTQLTTKQKNEINVLRKKISTGKMDLEKAKAIELEQLLHKFQNLRQEIELAQQREILKFQAKYRNYVPDQKLGLLSRKKTSSKFDQGILPNIIYSSNVSPLDIYKASSYGFLKVSRSTKTLRGRNSNNNSHGNIEMTQDEIIDTRGEMGRPVQAIEDSIDSTTEVI